MSLERINPILVKYDPGKHVRDEDDNGDCQVRALTVAAGTTYGEAWDKLYALQGKYRTNGFNICLYLDRYELGVKQRIPFPAKRGEKRMTAKKFVKLYSKGRFILHQAHHVVAVVNGSVYDSWDSTDRCVYEAWEVTYPVAKVEL